MPKFKHLQKKQNSNQSISTSQGTESTSFVQSTPCLSTHPSTSFLATTHLSPSLQPHHRWIQHFSRHHSHLNQLTQNPIQLRLIMPHHSWLWQFTLHHNHLGVRRMFVLGLIKILPSFSLEVFEQHN